MKKTINLPAPQDTTVTVSGFKTQKVESLNEHGWKIRAELILTNLPDIEGVKVRPIVLDVLLTRADVAGALSIDTSVDEETWLAEYNTKTIIELEEAVIAGAMAKALASFTSEA